MVKKNNKQLHVTNFTFSSKIDIKNNNTKRTKQNQNEYNKKRREIKNGNHLFHLRQLLLHKRHFQFCGYFICLFWQHNKNHQQQTPFYCWYYLKFYFLPKLQPSTINSIVVSINEPKDMYVCSKKVNRVKYHANFLCLCYFPLVYRYCFFYSFIS